MNKIVSIFRGLLNTLMTLIIIIGIVLILLYLKGIEPFIVLSGSMEPTIETGSISFIDKRVEYEKIKENDVIAFEASELAKVTHRVTSISKEGLETKGDANNSADGILTTKTNYIGKNVFSIPKVGYVVRIIQTRTGKILLGTIVIVLLIATFLTGETLGGKRYSEAN